jgi:hypothetical protein
MAYAQWVVINLGSNGTTLSIKNAQLSWGKFFKNPEKDCEISTDEINRIQILSGNVAVIASCGRSDAASGTEGTFDIYDGATEVGNFYWDCPWGSKRNHMIWTPSLSENYVTQVTGGNLDTGALGTITMRCVKI